MSKFIQIEDQIYKIPNEITIGRGEPFTVLNEDRNVSRAHAVLKFQESKWYLKNLDNSETYINGSKTISKKFIEVDCHDEIVFGKSKIKLLEAEPATSYITVKSTTHDLSKTLSLIFLKWFYVLIFLGLVFVSASNKKFSIQVIIFDWVITGIVLAATYYFIKRETKKVTPKEVIVAKDGFTVHFHNDKNMTFGYKDINYWTVWPWMKCVVIVADKRDIFISTKDHQAVLDFLENHMVERKGRTPWWRLIMVACLIPSLFSLDNDQYLFYLISLFFLGVSGMTGLYYGFRYEKGKKQKWSIIPGALCSLFVSVISYQSEPIFKAERLQSNCIDGHVQSCKSINYYALEKDPHNTYYFDPSALSKACENKNESACHYLKDKKKSRNIAGERK